MTIPKLALTFEEAAEACGYSVRTLKYHVAAGNLLARYANSKGVIRVEDLAQWLDDLPAEPRSGHQPVGFIEDDKGDTQSASTPGKGVLSVDTPPKPAFRTPEEVAPELGLAKSAVRQYAKASGFHTRVGKNRIMLTQDDVDSLVTWIREQKTKEQAEARKHDPFA